NDSKFPQRRSAVRKCSESFNYHNTQHVTSVFYDSAEVESKDCTGESIGEQKVTQELEQADRGGDKQSEITASFLKLKIPQILKPKIEQLKTRGLRGESVFYDSMENERITNEDKKDFEIKVISDHGSDHSAKSSETKDEGELKEHAVKNNFIQHSETLTTLMSMKIDESIEEDCAEEIPILESPNEHGYRQPKAKPIMDTFSNNQTMETSSHQQETGRKIRSASEPTCYKPKTERPLSAPNFRNSFELESCSTLHKNLGKAAAFFGRLKSGTTVEKSQKKENKNKDKDSAKKFVDKRKEKQDGEHTANRSEDDSVEEEPIQYTLRDFTLNLEPIDLMKEIFTGSEWQRYLPGKSSSDEEDSSDQLIPNDVIQPKDENQPNAPLPEPEPEPEPEESEETAEDVLQDNTVNSHPHIEQKLNGSIFAIPKRLPMNNATSDDIYDCVGLYILPKNHDPLLAMQSKDFPLLDFSTMKPIELLDNSALKNRIRLSKKRPHRPPKKHKKASRRNRLWRKVCRVTLFPLPRLIQSIYLRIHASTGQSLHNTIIIIILIIILIILIIHRYQVKKSVIQLHIIPEDCCIYRQENSRRSDPGKSSWDPLPCTNTYNKQDTADRLGLLE
ncbi:hypothetical protein DNTS_001684, partial [Danionella cerebrum]